MLSLFLSTLAVVFFIFHIPWFYALLVFLFLMPFVITLALDLDLVFPQQILFAIFPFLLSFLYFQYLSLNRADYPSLLSLSFVILFLVTSLLFYLQFLTLNIINVATVRTIPLKRVALSVYFAIGILLTFFYLYFLQYSTLSTFLKTVVFFLLSLAVFEAVFFANQTMFNSQGLSQEIMGKPKLFLNLSAVLALAASEVFVAISFLKVSGVLGSVFLTALIFGVLSIHQHRLEKTITKSLIREYLTLLVLFFFVFIFFAGAR